MKNYSKFFAVASSLLALASCSNKAEFVHQAFVSSDVKEMEVKENAGTASVGITAYNITSEATVTYEIGGTAVPGTDYRILGDADGVLTFTEPGTKNIEFEIIDQPLDLQGERTIVISLYSVNEAADLGPIFTTTLSIVDVVEFNWDWLADTWVAEDRYAANDGPIEDSAPYEVEIRKVDDTTCELYNLWEGDKVLTGTVDFDSQTISFETKQVVYDATALGYGNLVLVCYDGGWTLSSPVVAKMTATGVKVQNWSVVITSGQYANYVWDDPYTTHLKRKAK